jgi:hypothetical protein
MMRAMVMMTTVVTGEITMTAVAGAITGDIGIDGIIGAGMTKA